MCVYIYIHPTCKYYQGLPWGSVAQTVKESACNAGDLAGSSPGEGHGNPLQHSCLEKSMGRGAWRATVPGSQRAGHDRVTNSQHYKYRSTCEGFPNSSSSRILFLKLPSQVSTNQVS